MILLSQTTTPDYSLSLAGWIIMIVSVGTVTGLFFWCIWRVLHESSPEKLESQVTIEPAEEGDDPFQTR